MEDVCTPSINAELMPRFLGQRVRLVCELEDPGDGITILAKTSDKASVTIQKDPRTNTPGTKYVEFIGTVIDARTLKEESNSNWGDSFDLAMHNECVHLMNGKYASMFNRV